MEDECSKMSEQTTRSCSGLKSSYDLHETRGNWQIKDTLLKKTCILKDEKDVCSEHLNLTKIKGMSLFHWFSILKNYGVLATAEVQFAALLISAQCTCITYALLIQTILFSGAANSVTSITFDLVIQTVYAMG